MKDYRRNDTVLKNILSFASSNMIRQVMGLFTALLRPKLLGPEMFGLWNLLNVLPNYATYMHLGSRSAMRFRIPLHEARGELDQVRAVLGTVYWGSLAGALFFAAGGVAFALLAPGWETVERIGLVIAALTVLPMWYYDFVVNLLKGEQQFRLVAGSNIIRAFATLGFTVVLTWFFGVYGALISLPLTFLAIILYFQRKGILRPWPGFSMPLFKGMVRQGFPILLFNLVTTLLRSVDKFIISGLLGNRMLGFYAIATMLMGYLMNIPGVSREVTEAKLMESMKDGMTETHFQDFFMKPVLTTAFLMPFLIGPVVILLPSFLPLILPQFSPGIPAAQILALGSFFYALSMPVRGVLVAKDWQTRALPWMAMSVAANAGVSFALVKMGYGIEGVAWSSTIAFFLLFAALFLFVVRGFGLGLVRMWRPVAVLALSFPLMFFNYWLSGELVEHWTGPIQIIDGTRTVIFYLLTLLAVVLAGSGGFLSFQPPKRLQKLLPSWSGQRQDAPEER